LIMLDLSYNNIGAGAQAIDVAQTERQRQIKDIEVAVLAEYSNPNSYFSILPSDGCVLSEILQMARLQPLKVYYSI